MIKLKRDGNTLYYHGKSVMIMANLDYWDFPDEAKEFWISASLKRGGVPIVVYLNTERTLIEVGAYKRIVPIVLEHLLYSLDIELFTWTTVYLELWYQY